MAIEIVIPTIDIAPYIYLIPAIMFSIIAAVGGVIVCVGTDIKNIRMQLFGVFMIAMSVICVLFSYGILVIRFAV